MTFKASANEMKIITNFAEGANAFSFWDGGISTDNSGTWGEILNEEISSLCGVTTKSATGIMGSLVKKDFFRSTHTEDAYPNDNGTYRPGKWIELTELGVEVILARREELKELEEEYGEDVEDKNELAEALAEIEDFEVIHVDAEIEDAIAEETGDEADDESNDDEETDEELPEPVPAAVVVSHRAPTAHSDCDHPTEGTEGKKARARCRAARAKAAAKSDA